MRRVCSDWSERSEVEVSHFTPNISFCPLTETSNRRHNYWSSRDLCVCLSVRNYSWHLNAMCHLPPLARVRILVCISCLINPLCLDSRWQRNRTNSTGTITMRATWSVSRGRRVVLCWSVLMGVLCCSRVLVPVLVLFSPCCPRLPAFTKVD